MEDDGTRLSPPLGRVGSLQAFSPTTVLLNLSDVHVAKFTVLCSNLVIEVRQSKYRNSTLPLGNSVLDPHRRPE